MRNYVVVRGAGDLATGVIYRLMNSGFNVVALEVLNPSVIRRTVSFAQAVYDKTYKVEEITGERVYLNDDNFTEKIDNLIDKGMVPIVIDPKAESIKILQPKVVIDAILAKRNLGTTIDMADIVIGLGPGFTANEEAPYGTR